MPGVSALDLTGFTGMILEGKGGGHHTEIPKSCLLRVLNVELLQKAMGYFRRPETSPPSPLQMADIDQRIGGSRSKRSQIKHVLRRYEQGAVTQAEAVEEILKLMR